MPVLIFVPLQNGECDCFAPFIVLLYYLCDTSVKYSCLYTELYQWSVPGHVAREKKSCSPWDVDQLSKSRVLQNFLSIDTAAKTIHVLNISCILMT